MTAQASTASGHRTLNVSWPAVLGAGIAAGVVFGLMVHFVLGVMPMIGTLYGVESAAVGWVAHLAHSLVFAGLYAVAVTRDPFAGWTDGLGGQLGVGVAYGVGIWLIAAAFVMPVWLSAVGAAEPPVPNVNVQSLVGHAVFGGVLAVAYGAWTE